MKDYTEKINTEIMRILTENPIIGENGKKVHVVFAYYDGGDVNPSQAESNIVFRRSSSKVETPYGSSRTYFTRYYYYFDVHSKTKFFDIINKLIDVLEDNNFTYHPDLDGEDSFDPYTGQYCRAVMFSVRYNMIENKIQKKNN